MKAHVISNGPSAGEYHPRFAVADKATVLVVNALANRIVADWICVHDGNVFGRSPDEIQRGVPVALDFPRLFDDANRPQWLGAGLGAVRKRWFVHWHALDWIRANRPGIAEYLKDEWVMTWPASHPDLPYTGLAPLVLLPMLGITEAVLWGYDMAGQAGTLPGANDTRTPERWRRESGLFCKLAAEGGLSLTFGPTGERYAPSLKP